MMRDGDIHKGEKSKQATRDGLSSFLSLREYSVFLFVVIVCVCVCVCVFFCFF